MTVSNGKSARTPEEVLDNYLLDIKSAEGRIDLENEYQEQALAALEEIMDKQVIGDDVPHLDDKCEPEGGCVCYAGGLQVFQNEQRERLRQAFSNGGGDD